MTLRYEKEYVLYRSEFGSRTESVRIRTFVEIDTIHFYMNLLGFTRL